MDIFNVLTMIGGLALFLYGMHVMGDGLAKTSGGKLEVILEKFTSKTLFAVLLGAGVTAVIQSSSAFTRSLDVYSLPSDSSFISIFLSIPVPLFIPSTYEIRTPSRPSVHPSDVLPVPPAHNQTDNSCFPGTVLHNPDGSPD